jgi:hypothetical protein
MNPSRYRIFADAVPYGAGPPKPEAAPALDVEPSPQVIEHDHLLDAVSRVLDSQPEPGESVQRGFDRKERELRAFFAQLDHDARAALHLRLTAGETDDPLLTKLARVSTERRHRLIASLGEAPKRRAR